ncbi:MAG: M20 family metallopeptidase, partial [Desulfobacterales bacterium]|nr:M20 family metallopeptidase [Desulfobacterales bacterium]
GVAQVAKVAGQALPSPLQLQSLKTSGKEMLWTCRHGPSGEDPILLVGHLDTVFPPGTFEGTMVFQDPYLLGPGVADMKGGLVVILGALRVLDHLNLLAKIPLL